MKLFHPGVFTILLCVVAGTVPVAGQVGGAEIHSEARKEQDPVASLLLPASQAVGRLRTGAHTGMAKRDERRSYLAADEAVPFLYYQRCLYVRMRVNDQDGPLFLLD